MAAITLEDVAREAGVSKMTVSLALRGKGRLAEATRNRIRGIADRTGYRPNAAARAVANGRHGCLALVLSDHVERSYLPRDLLLGVERAVAARGAHLLVTHLDDAQLARTETMPRVLREWACDGLLLNYQFAIPPALVRHVERHATPVVWLNADLPRDCVRHDDCAVGRMATQHLLALGHRRIVYADLNYEVARRAGPLHYSRTERVAGYREAMRAANLRPEEWRTGLPLEREAAAAAVARRLRAAGHPTACVLATLSSLPLLREAAIAAGCADAGALSLVVACNGDEGSAWGLLPASTVELCQAALGAAAVDLLWRRMDHGARHFDTQAIAPVVVPRETSTLPPGGACPAVPTRRSYPITLP